MHGSEWTSPMRWPPREASPIVQGVVVLPQPGPVLVTDFVIIRRAWSNALSQQTLAQQ